jgi:hypothetical protein
VARLLCRLLTKIKDAKGQTAKTAAFLDLYMMPVAIIRRLVPVEAGASTLARQRQSLADRLRIAHTGIEITRLWHAGQAAAADCRRRRRTSTPVTSPNAQRKRRIQKSVIARCHQGRYRRALRMIDRNPLLDLSVPENLSVYAFFTQIPPRLSLPLTLRGCRLRQSSVLMRSSPSCALWTATPQLVLTC